MNRSSQKDGSTLSVLIIIGFLIVGIAISGLLFTSFGSETGKTLSDVELSSQYDSNSSPTRFYIQIMEYGSAEDITVKTTNEDAEINRSNKLIEITNVSQGDEIVVIANDGEKTKVIKEYTVPSR